MKFLENQQLQRKTDLYIDELELASLENIIYLKQLEGMKYQPEVSYAPSMLKIFGASFLVIGLVGLVRGTYVPVDTLANIGLTSLTALKSALPWLGPVFGNISIPSILIEPLLTIGGPLLGAIGLCCLINDNVNRVSKDKDDLEKIQN